LAVWLRLWAEAIDPRDALPSGFKGHRMAFLPTSTGAYEIRSVKGAMVMGTLVISPQWRAPKFTPAPDAVFDKQSLAEIYAQMRAM
jgi:hypothetical protein